MFELKGIMLFDSLMLNPQINLNQLILLKGIPTKNEALSQWIRIIMLTLANLI